MDTPYILGRGGYVLNCMMFENCESMKKSSFF